jgi:hypothetical protein
MGFADDVAAAEIARDEADIERLMERFGGFGLLIDIARRIAADEARPMPARSFAHAIVLYATGWERAESETDEAA